MNSFDISELSTSLGIGGIGILAVLGIATVGTIIYKKIMTKVSLTINGFHFSDTMTTHLNITIKNLKSVRIMVIYHFEYRDFISKKFSINLGEKQTKTVNISDEAVPATPSTVNGKLFKIVVDTLKEV